MRRAVWSLVLVGGCVAQNPDWDGVVPEGSVGESSSSSTMPHEATSAPMDASGPHGESASATSDASDDDESEGDAESSSSESGPMPVACDADPPAEGMCPAECNGGCVDGACRIECATMPMMATCEGDAIVCPEGWPCVIDCRGNSACRDATIVCPSDHACALECAGDHACEKAHVECGAATCAVSCVEHEHACTQTQVACGAANTQVTCDREQDKPPHLEPDEGSACACELNGC
ncbi:MAG TPA: hypothetical protein VG755_11910 [Nannocystaceae bacterium]|nr:hypothetical protein [Nannocystaceae bacterium]